MTNPEENRPENAQLQEDIAKICRQICAEPDPLSETAKQAIAQYEEITKALIGPEPIWLLPMPDRKTFSSTP